MHYQQTEEDQGETTDLPTSALPASFQLMFPAMNSDARKVRFIYLV